jgi:predicted nucleic acid-binding protein
MILLDTSVLSAVLRRRRKGEREAALADRVATLLAGERQVAVPGIVLQELLSGISERAQHARVLASVRESFPVVLATEGDHLKAADLVSLAASRGRALSTPDALIAAQALNRRASLLTSDEDDEDFERLKGLGALKLL